MSIVKMKLQEAARIIYQMQAKRAIRRLTCINTLFN